MHSANDTQARLVSWEDFLSYLALDDNTYLYYNTKQEGKSLLKYEKYTNMLLTKRKWILIGVLIVLLGGTLTYFGWTKQKSEPVKSQPEQPKPEVITQVRIPSSLSAKDVVSQFGFSPHLFYYDWAESREDFYRVGGREILGIESPSKGFTEMINGTFFEVYSKKDGIKVYGISKEIPIISILCVLKYEKPEFAQEDYTKISVKQELKDSNLKGVKVKTKVGLPPEIKEEFSSGLDPEDFKPEYFKPERYQQYLLRSNNFIIYVFGLKEAAEDVMIRVIDQYTTE